MDAIELARLRVVAESMTPDTWEQQWVESEYNDWTNGIGQIDSTHMFVVRALAGSDVDAAFMAAFDPSTVLALLDLLAEKDGVIKMLHASREQSYKNVDKVLADWRTLREHILDIDAHVTEQVNPFSNGASQLAHRFRSADHAERSALQDSVRGLVDDVDDDHKFDSQQRLLDLLDNNEGTK